MPKCRKCNLELSVQSETIRGEGIDVFKHAKPKYYFCFNENCSEYNKKFVYDNNGNLIEPQDED